MRRKLWFEWDADILEIVKISVKKIRMRLIKNTENHIIVVQKEKRDVIIYVEKI